MKTVKQLKTEFMSIVPLCTPRKKDFNLGQLYCIFWMLYDGKNSNVNDPDMLKFCDILDRIDPK